MLHTFTRCILRCREEIDLNERLAIRIVEYLMDNHAAIFAVPADLKTDVDERLVYLRRGQVGSRVMRRVSWGVHSAL